MVLSFYVLLLAVKFYVDVINKSDFLLFILVINQLDAQDFVLQ